MYIHTYIHTYKVQVRQKGAIKSLSPSAVFQEIQSYIKVHTHVHSCIHADILSLSRARALSLSLSLSLSHTHTHTGTHTDTHIHTHTNRALPGRWTRPRGTSHVRSTCISARKWPLISRGSPWGTHSVMSRGT